MKKLHIDFIFTLLCVFLGFSVYANDKTEQGSDLILFEIEETSYSLGDFRWFLLDQPALQAMATTRAGIQDALYEFIDSKVFRLEGLRTGFSAGAGIEDTSAGYFYAIQFSLLGKCPKPEEAEIKQYYDNHPEIFSSPPLVRVDRLALPEDASIGAKSALEFMRTSVDAVQRGERKFERLIDEVKAAQPAGTEIMQGDMGFQIVALAHAKAGSVDALLGHAKKGDIVGPIQQDGYVFVFRVSDRREAMLRKWETVAAAGDIERAMYRECTNERLQELRKILYKRFKVQLNIENIEKITPLGS